eukprot:scaffold59715_cov33-Phaeocystis_antarctica.AAC.1
MWNYHVVLTLTAAGSVEDFADTTELQGLIAASAGVDASATSIAVAAASAAAAGEQSQAQARSLASLASLQYRPLSMVIITAT